MLPRLAFAIVICMSTFAAAQSLPVPQAVTDPAQLQSATVENLQKFSIPALYSTRQIGGSAWSPDGSAGRLHLQHQRTQQSLDRSRHRWLAHPAHHQRPAPGLARLVARRQVDRLHQRQGRQRALGYLPRQPAERRSHQPHRLARRRQRSSRLVARLPPRRLHDQGQNLAQLRNRNHRHRLAPHHPRHPQLSAAARQLFAPLVARRHTRSPTPRRTPAARIPTSSSTTSPPKPPPTSRPTPATRPSHAAAFSPDGKTLLVTSNAANGYDNVALLDIASKHLTWITADKWEIHAGSFSPDGHSIVWSANVDGREALYSRAARRRRSPAPSELPEGVNAFAGNPSPWSRDGRRLLYYHSGASAPNDLYVFDLKSQAVHPAHQLLRRRTQPRQHGHAHPRPLPQQGRQIHHLRLGLHPQQHRPQPASIPPSSTSTEAPLRSPWTASIASSNT